MMTVTNHPYAAELDAAVAAAAAGAAAIRPIYERADAGIYDKADGSPVTDADLASDRTIRAVLGERFPADPILTEEGVDDPIRLASDRCWIVDPLDGTKEFVARSGDFDVLVALAVGGRPVAVAGCHPPSGLICTASLGGGAWISTPDSSGPDAVSLPPDPPGQPPRLLTATWFGAPGNLPVLDRVAARLGSPPPVLQKTGFSPRIFLALDAPRRRADALIGLLAAPGTKHQMGWEWDFIVSDLFIREAGGMVTDLFGSPHRYNKPDTLNSGGLIATADAATHQRLLAAIAPELSSN
jgi:3'-phosphoadenosine 5'-phosphosulfate (PAPS) 3'-phosphatase